MCEESCALDIYWAVISMSCCVVVYVMILEHREVSFSTITEPALVCTVEPAAVGQIQPEYTTVVIAIQVLFYWSSLHAEPLAACSKLEFIASLCPPLLYQKNPSQAYTVVTFFFLIFLTYIKGLVVLKLQPKQIQNTKLAPTTLHANFWQSLQSAKKHICLPFDSLSHFFFLLPN